MTSLRRSDFCGDRVAPEKRDVYAVEGTADQMWTLREMLDRVNL